MSDDDKNHLLAFLSKGLRFDGRKLDEFRKTKIEYDVSSTAEGSAKVTIGDTCVIAGVKMLMGAPYPDAPDQGSIMVNAELLPLSSPDFESGPPGIDSIELARVVDRGIRESKTIDLKKLCVKKGEKCWIVSIDICTLNASGNLLDACALAALAALKQTKIPEYDGEKVDYKKPTTKSLPLQVMPLAVTVFKIGPSIIVDPLTEEEKLFDARLTITTTEKGEICALQKGGATPLTIDEIESMVDLALKKSKELRKHL